VKICSYGQRTKYNSATRHMRGPLAVIGPVSAFPGVVKMSKIEKLRNDF